MAATLSDILNTIPWLVLLVVFVGGTWERLKLTQVLADTVQRAQAGLAPVAASPTPAQPAAPAKTVPTAVQPPAVPSGPFADYPAWFQWSLHEIGFHETGANQGLDRYIGMAHAGSNGDPWCAIFANAALEASGIPGSRSAIAQSFRTNPNFVQLSGPAKGCIVVYWRGSQASGLGHVGFYRGEDATRIWTLGGNENDMVQIEALPKSSATFGLIGYWWPKSLPLPAIGAVLMPAGSPVSVQAAPASAPAPANASGAVQSNIIATYFGGQQSAYGGPIHDDQPGVALPFRFTGARPRVRVTGVKSGASVDCDIVDVGPWNINDPYWQTGARPQSESGTDLGQVSAPRHTNGAGIDLTLAAATAVGIDGKGLVNWQFIDSTATPNVV